MYLVHQQASSVAVYTEQVSKRRSLLTNSPVHVDNPARYKNINHKIGCSKDTLQVNTQNAIQSFLFFSTWGKELETLRVESSIMTLAWAGTRKMRTYSDKNGIQHVFILDNIKHLNKCVQGRNNWIWIVETNRSLRDVRSRWLLCRKLGKGRDFVSMVAPQSESCCTPWSEMMITLDWILDLETNVFSGTRVHPHCMWW